MRYKAALLLLSAAAFAAPASGQSPSPKAHPRFQENAGIHEGVYRNPTFGFSYRVPFGWVDRTDDMQQDPEGEQTKANPGKSETLLAIFQRPPGASGDTINSAVIIAAEPLANYPQIKTAADYFGPITDLAEQQGLKVMNEPYAFSVGTKQLVRGDFSKERGKLTMWQSSLVMIAKGYIVSFTFMGGSQDEIEDLITGLNFGAPVHNSVRRK